MIAVALLTASTATGCSTYALAPITAAEARSDFAEGGSYRIAPPGAFLRRSFQSAAVGFGQPRLELFRYDSPEFPAIHRVSAGTVIKIERYVRLDQHGWYDGGANGWKFAIASVAEGPLRGKRFLIESNALNVRDPAALMLEPP
jgi:hypothetical protein